jgi:8-amino-7-oxononanoate synthase
MEHMDVFQKAFDFKNADQVREMGLYLYFRTIDSGQDPVVTMDGTARSSCSGPTTTWGLTSHPEIKEAAVEGAGELRQQAPRGRESSTGTLEIHDRARRGAGRVHGARGGAVLLHRVLRSTSG